MTLLEYTAPIIGLVALGLTIDARRTWRLRCYKVFFKNGMVLQDAIIKITRGFITQFFENESGRLVFMRSVDATLILFIIFSLLCAKLLGTSVLELFEDAQLVSVIGLSFVLLSNIVADYLSLGITREILDAGIGKKKWFQLFLLVVDLVAKLLVVSFFIGLCFFLLAVLFKPHFYLNDRNLGLIPWQMCYQYSSLASVYNGEVVYFEQCDVFGDYKETFISNPLLEATFNSTSLITSYATSIYLVIFYFLNVCRSVTHGVLHATTQSIRRIVSTKQHPGLIVAFAVIFISYLIDFLIYVFQLLFS